jgi:hypothetical protein
MFVSSGEVLSYKISNNAEPIFVNHAYALATAFASFSFFQSGTFGLTLRTLLCPILSCEWAIKHTYITISPPFPQKHMVRKVNMKTNLTLATM